MQSYKIVAQFFSILKLTIVQLLQFQIIVNIPKISKCTHPSTLEDLSSTLKDVVDLRRRSCYN